MKLSAAASPRTGESRSGASPAGTAVRTSSAWPTSPAARRHPLLPVVDRGFGRPPVALARAGCAARHARRIAQASTRWARRPYRRRSRSSSTDRPDGRGLDVRATARMPIHRDGEATPVTISRKPHRRASVPRHPHDRAGAPAGRAHLRGAAGTPPRHPRSGDPPTAPRGSHRGRPLNELTTRSGHADVVPVTAATDRHARLRGRSCACSSPPPRVFLKRPSSSTTPPRPSAVLLLGLRAAAVQPGELTGRGRMSEIVAATRRS